LRTQQILNLKNVLGPEEEEALDEIHTRQSRRYYTIRTGSKPTNNPQGVRKIAQAETRRAKRAEANGKSNDKKQHQRQWRKTNTPKASREDMQDIWQRLSLGVGSPSGTMHTRAKP
jgi:hypothetical protein